ADRPVFGGPIPFLAARVVLRQVLVGTAGVLRSLPRALRLEEPVRRRGWLSVRECGSRARGAEPVRHVSGQAKLASDRRLVRGPVDGLQQQFRHVPLGGGIADRLQRPVRLCPGGDESVEVGWRSLTFSSEEMLMVAAHRCLSLVVVAALLYGVPAAAQNGRIRGTVRDASGGSVSGVTIRAQGPGAGRATSSSDGTYRIDNLTPGTYVVAASLPGLRTQSQQNVSVTASGETVVDFVMQALELEAVTVTAMLREQRLADVPF